MKQIYIQTRTTEHWAMVFEDNQLDRVIVNRPNDKSLIGNLYFGRIVNIESSLQAAFVDYGQSKLGFLKKNEILSSRYSDQPIEKMIYEGQKVWVQVTKDAFDQKGAQLTANVTIPGTSLVYLPFGNYYGISKRIPTPERDELKAWAEKYCVEEEGLIFRTSATKKNEQELLEELHRLRVKWKDISEGGFNKAPVLAWEDKEIPDQLLRYYTPDKVEQIFVDEIDMKKYIEKQAPQFEDKCSWTSQFDQQLPLSPNQLIQDLTKKSVPLANGADITIEQTEALVIIDVNTGKHTNTKSKQMAVVKTNEFAAKEIAKQLRLRNLSGMIVIDFISMRDSKDHHHILSVLKKELKKDYTRTEVYGFTKLGLVEVTRKREAQSLPSIFTSKKENVELNPETEAYLLERELISYKAYDQEIIVMEVKPEVVEQFKKHIDREKLKSLLYKEVYVLNNRKSHASFRVIFMGNEDALRERSFYKENTLDRLF